MDLCTDTIALRPITEADTQQILLWRNSQAVKQYFIYRKDITPEEHLNWLNTRVKTGKVHQFIITLKDSGASVGSVYIQSVDYVHKNAEYGIFIGDINARGKGCGTDAAKLMIRYSFETLGLHKLYLRVLANNSAAIRSYEKAGFITESIMRDEIFADGKFHDVIRMSIIKEAQ